MRPNYTVSSTEMLTEIRDLQETMIGLIGYDSNAFDNVIDVSGQLDVLEAGIDASGYALLQSRLYQPIPNYSYFYKHDLILYYMRRSIYD